MYDVLAALDKRQQYNCLILKETAVSDGSWGAGATRDRFVISINCGN